MILRFSRQFRCVLCGSTGQLLCTCMALRRLFEFAGCFEGACHAKPSRSVFAVVGDLCFPQTDRFEMLQLEAVRASTEPRSIVGQQEQDTCTKVGCFRQRGRLVR